MQLPTKIKIHCADYKIEWVDAEYSDGLHIDGHCLSQYHKLQINKDMPNFRIAFVFLHEVMHAIQDYSPLSEKNLTPEEACDLFGFGIVNVWRDNPLIFKWWQRLFKEV